MTLKKLLISIFKAIQLQDSLALLTLKHFLTVLSLYKKPT